MKVDRNDPPPPEPPPVPEATYTITLTEGEAKDLLSIIGCVGGEEGYPERKTTDTLWNKLDKATEHARSTRWAETPFQSVQLVRKSSTQE